MQPLRSIAALAGALLFAAFAPLAAAALPAGVKAGPVVEGIASYTLDNGLEVLLFPDPSQAKTTVNVTYKVGSRNERYGETGMAHLLEHLLFKGTPTRGNFWDDMQRRGFDFNGTTWLDRTNYHETFNANPADLDWALAMEADRMINSRVARADLDTEMTVVRNEMERAETSPFRVTIDRLFGNAYAWHSYGKSTLGARSDVENVDIASLQAFYRTYYQPDNAVLIVAGNFDPDTTLAAIAKYFGPIPKPTRTLPRLYTVEPVQDGERVAVVHRVGDTQIVAVGYHGVTGAHPDYVALDALSDIMTVAPSGRLYKALVEARKAANVQSWVPSLHDPGLVTFFAQVAPKESIDAARTAMIATLEGLKSAPITDAEVERVRVKSLTNFTEVLSNPSALGIQLSESIAAGDWRLFFLQRDRWRTLTAADVNRVAATWLKPANRTVALFEPDAKPDRAPLPAPVDVAALVKDYKGDAALSAGEAFDPTTANLEARTQRFTLPNGMKVALLPKKVRGETVKVAFQFQQGDAASLFGTAPQGALVAAMLTRGTTKHTRQELEDALDKLRAKVGFSGGETQLGGGLETQRPYLADALALVAEMLRTPSFPAAEFDEVKRGRRAGLEATRTNPENIASRTLSRHDEPYKRGDVRYVPTLDEEIARLDAATLDKVRDFHARFLGAGNGEIAIVGDFDPVAVKAQLAALFGDWKAPAGFIRVPRPLVPRTAADLKVEVPDKANAMLRGRLALPLNDTAPDYAAFLVANQIVGATGSSRLWKRVREKEGLSYGVGTIFSPSSFEPNSNFDVYAIFAPQNLAKLRTAVGEELGRVVREGVTDAEVADAKASLLRERQLVRAQDATVAGLLAQQAYLGRTFDFTGKIDADIARVSRADVDAAIRKYVKPEAFTWAFAGDFAKAP